MISHIDVSSVLRRSVCDLYSNLVTRPTGAAVRIGIEHHLDEIGDKALAVLDFSHVGLLDFSCADEIVAKLLMQYVSVDIPRREVYFVFYGMSESHLDAIEAVLERHGLALVTQLADGAPALIGERRGRPATGLGKNLRARKRAACRPRRCNRSRAGERGTHARHIVAPQARDQAGERIRTRARATMLMKRMRIETQRT